MLLRVVGLCCVDVRKLGACELGACRLGFILWCLSVTDCLVVWAGWAHVEVRED